jgi:hypothetical protein
MEERIRTIDRLKSTDSVEHLPIETTPNSRVDALKSTIRAANRRGACQSAPGRTQQKIAQFSPPRPSKSDASADLEIFRVAPEKAFFNGIDPLLPLACRGSRRSRSSLTSSNAIRGGRRMLAGAERRPDYWWLLYGPANDRMLGNHALNAYCRLSSLSLHIRVSAPG